MILFFRPLCVWEVKTFFRLWMVRWDMDSGVVELRLSTGSIHNNKAERRRRVLFESGPRLKPQSLQRSSAFVWYASSHRKTSSFFFFLALCGYIIHSLGGRESDRGTVLTIARDNTQVCRHTYKKREYLFGCKLESPFGCSSIKIATPL